MSKPFQDFGKPMFAEIWMCDLGHEGGSVQHGSRPVLILSNDVNNAHSTVVNVAPLTSRIDRKLFPMHVFLGNPSLYGLRRPSTLLVEQITTIPSSRCSFKVGQIADQATLKAIFRAIAAQFPLVEMFASDFAA